MIRMKRQSDIKIIGDILGTNALVKYNTLDILKPTLDSIELTMK